jgi:hypothetical protein
MTTLLPYKFGMESCGFPCLCFAFCFPPSYYLKGEDGQKLLITFGCCGGIGSGFTVTDTGGKNGVLTASLANFGYKYILRDENQRQLGEIITIDGSHSSFMVTWPGIELDINFNSSRTNVECRERRFGQVVIQFNLQMSTIEIVAASGIPLSLLAVLSMFVEHRR